MKLIINGDDFGITPGVSKGIIKAIKEGVMTDTSAMANMPYFEEAIKLAQENGINEMGIHLSLTCGNPMVVRKELRGLLNSEGNFPAKPNPDFINVVAAEKELRAQLEKFIKSGMKLNHIDSHHHFYVYDQGYLDLVIKLAKEYEVPIRCLDNEIINRYGIGYKFSLRNEKEDSIRYVKNNNVKCPDHIIVDFYENGVAEDSLIQFLKDCIGKYEVVEVMSHPAIVDEELRSISSYTDMREKELEVLTSVKVKKFINDNSIDLIRYSEL